MVGTDEPHRAKEITNYWNYDVSYTPTSLLLLDLENGELLIFVALECPSLFEQLTVGWQQCSVTKPPAHNRVLNYTPSDHLNPIRAVFIIHFTNIFLLNLRCVKMPPPSNFFTKLCMYFSFPSYILHAQFYPS